MILDQPWAIVYGPKAKRKGMLYGLGPTRKEAWENAMLVYSGFTESDAARKVTMAMLQRQGMVARRVIISTED
jgi:hypothetical protein